MKTDLQLQRDVLDELRWQPNVREAEIGVAAKDGVVTLTGTVENYAQKYAAERAAERTYGVKAVADDLNVKLPHSGARTDTEIAHAALNALRWNTEVPADKVKVKVEAGWISLNGDVEWQFQRVAAESAVRYLMGVNGVVNNLILRPPKASAAEVEKKIGEALKRSAVVDASNISVESREGRVTLTGTVRSFAERRDAEDAAWASAGVLFVDDRILVGV